MDRLNQPSQNTG